jgi:hypothetical protein
MTTAKNTAKATSIHQALIAAQKAIKNVGKDGQNTYDRYAYRTIDGVMDAVHAAFVQAGVVAIPKVISKEQVERTSRKGEMMIHTTLEVEYTFYAQDGSNVSAIVQGEGMDRGDKSINKAMSGAYKYAMFQVLAIPTAEMIDSETESPEIGAKKPAPKQPPQKQEDPAEHGKALREVLVLAGEAGMTVEDLEAAAKIRDLTALPTDRLKKCKTWLKKQLKEMETPATPAEEPQLTELEQLQDQVVALSDQAGISLETLAEQTGQAVEAMNEAALKKAVEYLEIMAAKQGKSEDDNFFEDKEVA